MTLQWQHTSIYVYVLCWQIDLSRDCESRVTWHKLFQDTETPIGS